MQNLNKKNIFIFLWLYGFMFQCTTSRSTTAMRSIDEQQVQTKKSGLSNQEDRQKEYSNAHLIEKKHFVDMVSTQNSLNQITKPSKKGRSEILLPGDHIQISLYEKLPVSQESRVELKRIDEDGVIFIYPLGNLNVAGMTLTQTREIIEQKMESYIVTPFCEVTLVKRDYEPSVFVFGEAMTLGAIPLRNGDRLLDILSSAGGTTPNAYLASVKIVRLYGDSVGVMSVDVNSIIKRGHIENNLVMQDQDILYIPKSLISGISEILTKLGSVLPWYYFVKNF